MVPQNNEPDGIEYPEEWYENNGDNSEDSNE